MISLDTNALRDSIKDEIRRLQAVGKLGAEVDALEARVDVGGGWGPLLVSMAKKAGRSLFDISPTMQQTSLTDFYWAVQKLDKEAYMLSGAPIAKVRAAFRQAGRYFVFAYQDRIKAGHAGQPSERYKWRKHWWLLKHHGVDAWRPWGYRTGAWLDTFRASVNKIRGART